MTTTTENAAMSATRTAVVGSPVGLHARPAKTLVAAAAKASKAGVKVTIASGDQPAADARSILSVIALGAGPGTEVVLTADGDGAEGVLDELAAIVESTEE